MIEIQERDMEILKLINRFGAVKKGSLAQIFGGGSKFKNSYIVQRFKKLEEFKFLKSRGQAFMLGSEGKKILEKNNIKIAYTKTLSIERVREVYRESDLVLKLDFKYTQSRIEYIREMQETGYEINNVRTYAGVVWNDPNDKYFIYRIKGEITNRRISDIGIDISKDIIKKIIIVLNDLEQLEKLLECLKQIKAKRIYVIPETEEGINLIRLMNQNKLINKNIVSYIEPRTNYEITEENERLYYKNAYMINQMIIELKSLRRGIVEATINNEKNLYICIDYCYKKNKGINWGVNLNFNKDIKIATVAIHQNTFLEAVD